jgi:hypothetical protein
MSICVALNLSDGVVMAVNRLGEIMQFMFNPSVDSER